MNKDQVKGRANEAVGKAKEVIGGAIGNAKLHNEGLGQELKGKVQKNVGDIKNKVAKNIDR